VKKQHSRFMMIFRMIRLPVIQCPREVHVSAPASSNNATVFLEALHACGVRHVFANAGTDFAPVIEALVQAEAAGLDVPQFHPIPHENLAVAMAHAYYLRSREPVAVMVHVTVGTANALCGLMNASRDNIPLLLMAGRSPHTERGHRASRNASIHWGQDSFDQAGAVREYVKWDYELREGQPVGELVQRALDIATQAPGGPVYLSLPREVLDAPAIDGEGVRPLTRPLGGLPALPDADAVRALAARVAKAEQPILLTANAGRNPDNVARLSALAEQFGVGVGQSGEPGARDLNIPLASPGFLGAHPGEALSAADLVLVLDAEVPWWPRYATPSDEAEIVHIGPDPLFSRYPIRGYRCDTLIAGDSSAALVQLLAELQSLIDSDPEIAAGISRRRDALLESGQKRLDARRRTLTEAAAGNALTGPAVAALVNEVLHEQSIVVNELGVPMDLLDLQVPGSYLSSSPAGGLGYGLGAALGAKMASPEHEVILIVGDGSYLFGNPLPAHLVSRSLDLPTLTIVLNNGRWHAVQRSTLAVYPDGEAAAASPMPLVELGYQASYEAVMAGFEGLGLRAQTTAGLRDALREGLAAVRAGRPALINAICPVA
jgi:acetolactate synthase-1/2/3 large subunit